MANPGQFEDDMLSVVTGVRARNNNFWMELMRIALKANPKKTKELIQQIILHDREVTKAMQAIVDGPQDPDQAL